MHSILALFFLAFFLPPANDAVLESMDTAKMKKNTFFILSILMILKIVSFEILMPGWVGASTQTILKQVYCRFQELFYQLG